MTTEHSTYTYEGGAQETVILRRGPITPRGHAVLRIDHSDGRIADCYVNTAWLRGRVNDLDPRPLAPDAITDEMVRRALDANGQPETSVGSPSGRRLRVILAAALTEPPARPEGAEELETVIGLNAGKWTNGAEDVRALADLLASKGVRAMEAE